MIDHYETMAEESTGFFKDKGSKFFAHAYPVQNEEEVKGRLEHLRKQYHDARHYCYAFSIGLDQPYQRANDDGEPNHSAGDPILGQIKSMNLQNVLIVVIRYFGGTKLGVGGLINAYKTAASEALHNGKVIKKYVTVHISIKYPYENTNDVMRAVNDLSIQITNQDFAEHCSLDGKIVKSKTNQMEDYFKLLPTVRWTIE